MAVVEELVGQEVEINAEDPKAKREYIVYAATDEADAQAAVLASPSCPSVWGGVPLQSVSLSEKGNGVWRATANYAILDYNPDDPPIDARTDDPDDPDGNEDNHDETEPLGPENSCEIGAGTIHVLQSLETTAIGIRSDRDQNDKPYFFNAIGVSPDGTQVEGTEKTIPTMEWAKTVYYSFLTLKILKQWRSVVGKTNDRPFYTFDRGEMKYLGASVQKYVNNKGWPVTHKFELGENKTDVVYNYAPNPDFDPDAPEGPDNPWLMEDIVIDVGAFHHVWSQYDRDIYTTPKGKKIAVSRPRFAMVERIHEEANFKKLLRI